MKTIIEKNQLILLSAIVFVAVLFFGFNSVSFQDEWICQNGKWIARGNPDEAAKPVFDCRKTASSGIAYDVYCEKNDDCACGAHMSRNICFVGNGRYIDPTKKCDKLCESSMKLRCIKNQCKQIK